LCGVDQALEISRGAGKEDNIICVHDVVNKLGGAAELEPQPWTLNGEAVHEETKEQRGERTALLHSPQCSKSRGALGRAHPHTKLCRSIECLEGLKHRPPTHPKLLHPSPEGMPVNRVKSLLQINEASMQIPPIPPLPSRCTSNRNAVVEKPHSEVSTLLGSEAKLGGGTGTPGFQNGGETSQQQLGIQLVQSTPHSNGAVGSRGHRVTLALVHGDHKSL
jgi:hypothetical protein